MSQFSQVMDTGIEPIAVADEGVDIPAKSRHGFEDQNRYLLLGQPQGSAEAAGTAAYHDSVKICQFILLTVKAVVFQTPGYLIKTPIGWLNCQRF